MMHSLELKCKVITPMFMAGADGRTPELRPSEIKGMMRFWWRAIRAEDNIDKLRKEEEGIFGGTGEGQGKSKVDIRISNQNKNRIIGENLKNDYNLQWRFNRNTTALEGEHAGIGYLLYSTVLLKRAYIKDGVEFNLTLNSYDERTFKNACASLWLAIYLGGFGTRARRGGGNLEVTDVKRNSVDIDFTIKENDSDGLAKWLKENFKKVFKMINGCEQPKNFIFDFSNLGFSRFIVAKEGKDDWKSALNEIGLSYKLFREKNRKNIFESGAFGFPVRHHSGILKGKHSKRRNSPIIFKVLHSNNKYYWFVLRLAGKFLPEGEVLRFNDKTQKPDYKLIDEFWNEIKNKGKEFVLNKPLILDKIVNEIKKNQIGIKKIILFGSRARGDAYKNSDIDIAIEADGPIGEGIPLGPIDIVNLKRANNSLIKKIEKEGIVLYERKG